MSDMAEDQARIAKALRACPKCFGDHWLSECKLQQVRVAQRKEKLAKTLRPEDDAR